MFEFSSKLKSNATKKWTFFKGKLFGENSWVSLLCSKVYQRAVKTKMKLKSVFSVLIYFLLETQLKGKESNQGMMLTFQHQLKKNYIQWRGLQSQTVAKSYIKYTITISTTVHNYRRRSNTVCRQTEKKKNYNLLLPGWCYLIKIEVEER